MDMNLENNEEELENPTTDGEPSESLGENDEDSEPSLRDTLNDAIEASEDEEAGDTKAPEEAKDDKGGNDNQEGQKVRGENDSLPAPETWEPKAREMWSKVPVELQKLIRSNEESTQRLLQETNEARQTHEFMNQLAQGYAPVLAAEGVTDPKVGIKGIFDTVALLQNGSPADKAMKMAQMIQHYGIDIESLDAALVGQEPQNPESHQFEQIIEQKLQPVNQLLTELQNRQVQSQQQAQFEAQKEIEQFQGEFLNDVREDMADLIDAAVARGQEITLQKAYDMAVMLRPDLKEIVEQRKQNEALIGNRNKLTQKRNAASSIVGSRGGMSGGADTLRSAIEDAWDGV